MKVTVYKTWTTEVEVEIPDEKAGDRRWLAQLADKVANDQLDSEWTSTVITESDTDELLADW